MSDQPVRIDLSSAFLEVVEQAAIPCAHTMGQGDLDRADHVAVESIRATLDCVPIDGRVVIGEGERDEAPMLFIGEPVGMAHARSPLRSRPVRRESSSSTPFICGRGYKPRSSS